MIEIFFLTIFATITGVVFRAYFDEKKNVGYYFFLSIFLGVISGVYHYYYPIYILPLTVRTSLGVIFAFFMVGWVLSDLVDSFVFIARMRRAKTLKDRWKIISEME